MTIHDVDCEKISAVRAYLRKTFPDATFRTFIETREDWQTYCVDFEGLEVHCFSVSFEFFSDTHMDDIQSKLHRYRLAEKLRTAGRQPLLVTPVGVVDR